jgi:uncharacterized protein DUF2690
MKKKWNRSMAVATAAAAVAGTAALGSLPAQAAPCTYAGCNGLDPQTTGCSNDAVTKLDLVAGIGILAELRWSPSCHTFWTRLRWNPENGGQGQQAYIAGGVYDANGKPVTKIVYTTAADGSGPTWTRMISQAYPWERFCAFTANGDGCKITTL